MNQTTSSQATYGPNATAALTLLVTFFQTEGYGGYYDTVGGRFGTCDSAGYKFSDLRNVEFNVNGISSYKLNGACKYVDYWQGINYGGSKRTGYVGDNTFVGAPWNDNLLSMSVRS